MQTQLVKNDALAMNRMRSIFQYVCGSIVR